MRPICSSILCPLLLALFCEAYPASDSTDRRFAKLDRTAERFARIIDRFEKLKSDNLDADMERRGRFLDAIKERENLREMGSENSWAYINDDDGIEDRMNFQTTDDPVYDYAIDKRAASRGKYNYYKCYFNPVTCYRK